MGPPGRGAGTAAGTVSAAEAGAGAVLTGESAVVDADGAVGGTANPG